MSGIEKSFGHIRALRGADLEVAEGKITAVIGDNGSGKSTLIKILSGSLRPDGGVITVDGQDYAGLSVHKAVVLGIRTVYQDLALDNYKNSAENIFLGCELQKGPFLDRKSMREEAERLLGDIGIHIPDVREPVGRLSGGQRQGVAIARALLRPGKLLLLDEPTAAMGVQESFRTLKLLSSLRERGLTQLIVSHNLHQIFSLADYVYVMHLGRCIAHTATEDTTAEELQEYLLRQEREEAQL